MVRHYVLHISERLSTNSAQISLLPDLHLEQSLHFRWRPDLAIASWVMRIFNSLNRDGCTGLEAVFTATTTEP